MNTPAADARPAPDPAELRLLELQFARMRGMLFGYSERFFERFCTYLVLALTLLVISGMGVFPGASLFTTFLSRHDERRLLAELDAAQGPKAPPPSR